MKILIWKSYGNIDVYKISTQEDYQLLLNLLETILKQEEVLINEFNECKIKCESISLNKKYMCIENELLEFIRDSYLDSFEDIYFSDLIEL